MAAAITKQPNGYSPNPSHNMGDYQGSPNAILPLNSSNQPLEEIRSQSAPVGPASKKAELVFEKWRSSSSSKSTALSLLQRHPLQNQNNREDGSSDPKPLVERLKVKSGELQAFQTETDQKLLIKMIQIEQDPLERIKLESRLKILQQGHSEGSILSDATRFAKH